MKLNSLPSLSALALTALFGSLLQIPTVHGEESPEARPLEARSVAIGAALPEAPAIYPPTRRQDIVETLHGVEVADPYRWLEDANDASVQQWMNAQDDQARAHLEASPHREGLIERLSELSYIANESPPRLAGGRAFFSRRDQGQEKGVIFWRQGEDGEEKVLLDPNTWSDDGSVSLRGYWPSRDGEKVVYRKSINNADLASLHIRDVESGVDSEIDTIAGGRYAFPNWTPDSRGFFYTWLPTDPSIDPAELPGYAEVRFHRLGEDPEGDAVVFPALGDPKYFLFPTLSRDGRWLTLVVQSGWNRSDVYVKDLSEAASSGESAPVAELAPVTEPAAAGPSEAGSAGAGSTETGSAEAEAPAGEAPSTLERAAVLAAAHGFKPFATGFESTFWPTWWRGHFYVTTNYQAPKSRVLKATPEQIGSPDSWQELVPESDATLEVAMVVGDRLALNYARQAQSELVVMDLDGTGRQRIELPESGSVWGPAGEPDRDIAYFTFASYTRPSQVYELSMSKAKAEQWSNRQLPIDSSKMASKQVWYTSKDGTKVSMFIVARKDVELDGNNPTWLTGYGGFKVSMTPSFSVAAATWVERGGVYAVPNLRGGGEYGDAWHRAGMLENKQNVFDDFIAAAEYLIDSGYTRADKLAISGGSNGGLLVGAAMTQRPELFEAVICGVPLLDMVRYHLFGAGKTWIAEYGSAEDAEQFETLHAYSPYHRVQPGVRYPALLMMSATDDDRVDPMHARKFIAAVQAASATAERPALLRIEQKAGHGGGGIVKKRVLANADRLTFLFDQLSSEPRPLPAPTLELEPEAASAASGL